MKRYDLPTGDIRESIVGDWVSHADLEKVLPDIEEVVHYLEEHALGGDEVKRLRDFLGPRPKTDFEECVERS